MGVEPVLDATATDLIVDDGRVVGVRMVIEAAEQCGILRIPEVAEPASQSGMYLTREYFTQAGEPIYVHAKMMIVDDVFVDPAWLDGWAPALGAGLVLAVSAALWFVGAWVQGRLPGSTRFMAPEEHERGATIDSRTTVS